MSVKDNKFTYTLLLTTVFLFLISLTSLSIGIAVSLGIISIWCAIRKPEWLVLFLAAFIPFEPFLLKFVPADFYVFARYGSEGIIYLLFIIIACRWLTNYFQIKKVSDQLKINNEQLIIKEKKLHVTRYTLHITFLTLFIISLLSLVINNVPFDVGVLGLRQIFRFILLFFIIMLLTENGVGPHFPSFQKYFFTIIFAVVFIQSILGISQSLSGGRLDEFLLPGERKAVGAIQLTTGTKQFWEEGQRVFGTMGRYDQLGSFLAIMLLMVLAFLYEKLRITNYPAKPRLRPSAGELRIFKLHVTRYTLHALLFLGSITLLLTYSRASWIAFIAGLFVIGVLMKRDKKIIAGFLIALITFGVVYFSSGKITRYLIDSPRQTLSERLFEAASPSRWMGEYYGLGRMFFIINTPHALISHAPLYGIIGMGPGTFGGGVTQALHYTKSYGILGLPFGIWGTEGHIDNNWFSLLGEIGFLGVAVYLGILGLLGIVSVKLYRESDDTWYRAISLGYCGVLAAFFVLGFFAMYFEMRTLAPYVWMIGGIVITNYKLSGKAETSAFGGRITNERI